VNKASVGVGGAVRQRAGPRGLTLPLAGSVVGRLAESQALLLAALFAVAVVPRLWGLGRRSLSLDELTALGIAALDFLEVRHALTAEPNMSLYYWLLFAWLKVVGVGANETLIRLPSALIGAAAVPLVYVLGRRLHSPTAGMAAAGLLAVNGYHVELSQEARGYALWVSLTVLSFLLLRRAIAQPHWLNWAAHGLVNTLAFYSHFFTIFVVAAQAIFVVSCRSRAAIIGFVGGGLLMAALTVQTLPFFLRASGGAVAGDPLGVATPGRLVSIFNELSGGSVALAVLYLALAAIGVIGVRRGGDRRVFLLAIWLLVPIGLLSAISQWRPLMRTRYVVDVLPALPLLAGMGLSRLWAPIAIGLFGVVAGLSLTAGAERGAQDDDEPWRQAVAYAVSRAQPGDGWIFISKWSQHAFEYYAGWHWGRKPAPYADIFEPFDWSQVGRYPLYRGLQSLDGLDEFAAAHPRIWLVQWHEVDPLTRTDRTAVLRRLLDDAGYRWRSQEFRGIRVRLYERV
jgi:mannosyltransferase